MKDGVTMTRDNLAAFMRDVRDMAKRDVLVGIPGDGAERQKGDAMDNATLGYIHEFGAPAANIPARPFLIPGVASVNAQTSARLGRGMTAALGGDMAECDRQMHAAGLIAQNAVKARINSNIQPALSPRTLAARRARGRTGENTLVETGQLRNSVTYVVVGGN